MNMNIIQDTKNEVLGRREIIAEIEEEKIPSKDEVKAKLAALSETKAENMIIEKIETSFGNPKITVIAKTYDNKEAMKKFESDYSMKRNFKEEKKDEKKEEAPAKKAKQPAIDESTPKGEPGAENKKLVDEKKADDTSKEETTGEQ